VPPGIVQNWIILALPAAASAATIGVNGLLYQFSTGTSDTNPGSGKLAFNNASLSSATQLYINETDAAGAGMASVLALWDDSTSTTKGTLYVFKVGSLSSFAVFTISGSMTDAGSYDKFTLTHVASGGSFAANDQLSVLFVPKGDKGDSAVLATDTTWAAKGDLAVGTGDDAATILPVGSNGQVLTADSAEPTGVKWSSASGSGDVTAATAFGTDNRLLRSDGTAKGAQASGVTVDDTANMSGVATFSATTIELGHASDTTISRTGAGAIAVEGVEVALNSASLTHIANTIELGHATDTTISRTGAGAIAVEGVGVALNSTSLAHTAGTIELGHATDTTLSRSAAGELAVEGTIVKKVGKETIWIPAAAMTARTTNGAASGVTELTTNDIMLRSLDFDTTTEEGVGFMVAMPKSWNESTVTFKAFWTAASGSGGVAWGLAGYALSDDDAMDTAVSGQQIVTDTLITANDMHITSESSAITIGGTPAEGDVVYFEITREVGDAADTIAADAKLLGIHLYITTNASTDA
jgi:hypothetical protein